MIEKSIKELHEELKSGNITSEELVKEALEKSHEVQEKCNAFVTILDDAKGSEVTDDLLSEFLLVLRIIIQLKEFFLQDHLTH